jgi:NTE family protein
MTIRISDFAMFAKSLMKLAEYRGASKEELQKLLDEKTRVIYLGTGEQVRYNDLLKCRVDVDLLFVLNERMIVILFRTRLLTFRKVQFNS